MTPITEAKTTAITKTIQMNFGHDFNLTDIAELLAMLTSANKNEREDGKKAVRDMVWVGNEFLAEERKAMDLADRANHPK